jgi:hypothetical protein
MAQAKEVGSCVRLKRRTAWKFTTKCRAMARPFFSSARRRAPSPCGVLFFHVQARQEHETSARLQDINTPS